METSDILDKVKITSSNQLKPGDHIEFCRKAGYGHHAIVVDVEISTGRLKLIEYAKRKWNNWWDYLWDVFITWCKKEIQEQWIGPIDWAKDNAYIIQYRADECFSPHETIKRAREKIGERAYSLFTNNCEHFAVWAKTGERDSYQSREFFKSLWTSIKNVVVASGPYTSRMVLGDILPSAWSHIIEEFLCWTGLTLVDGIAVLSMLVIHTTQTGEKVCKAWKRTKGKMAVVAKSDATEREKSANMDIIKHEFWEKFTDAIMQCLIQSVCSIGGFILGQICIASSPVGSIGGVVVGSLVGIIISKFGPRAISTVWDYMSSAASAVWDYVSSAASTVWDYVSSAASTVWDYMSSATSSTFSVVSKYASFWRWF